MKLLNILRVIPRFLVIFTLANFSVLLAHPMTGFHAILATQQIDSGQTNYLVTPTSVGDIQIGMTVGAARKVFKNAKFTQTDYGEEGVWVEVTQDQKDLIRFSTDQENSGGDDDGNVPIDDSAKIETIEFTDEHYKTAEGVGIGTTVEVAEQKFGKIIKIELWEYDASEHAWFENAPKSYSFTIDPAKGSGEDATAGTYAKNAYLTTKYNAGAAISSITVSKEEIEE